MVDRIKKIILAGNKASLRLTLSEELLFTTNDVEQLVKFSKNKGIKLIETILINKIREALNFYTKSEKEDLIVDVISELSQNTYAAGWFDKIEYDLWKWNKNSVPEYINHHVIKDDLNDLRALSKKLNLWAIWEDSDSNPRAIDLQKWKERIELLSFL